MKRLLWVLLLALTVLLCGCENANQVQAQTANGIAQAANASLPILLQRMQEEGIAELKAVLARGGDREDAEAAAARVDAAWEPIWKAWDALRVAQGRWAAVIEEGGDLTSALSEMVGAYCDFKAIWPGSIPAMPLAPLRCSDE